MTELLISVRSAEEAREAMAGGADIIDVKEPSRGSLGACSIEDMQAVVTEVDGSVPVSAACGELMTLDRRMLASLPNGLSFAKIGLAGCGTDANWPSLWMKGWSCIPSAIRRVAVVYADWRRCDAPMPEVVIEQALRSQCRYVLIDTHSKAVPLLDLVSHEVLQRWLAPTLGTDLGIVIAGSLDVDRLETVVHQWAPDLVAIRGAACEGSRESSICREKTNRLKTTLDVIDRHHARL